MIQSPADDFSPEQHDLWTRVVDLWAMSKARETNLIRSTLHPHYVGWDLNSPHPHNREDAVRSVSGESPMMREYELHPLSVQVYDRHVGIVHYSYAATVVPKDGPPINVTGKWSEVYLKKDGTWLMISVSGKPDPPVRTDCDHSGQPGP